MADEINQNPVLPEVSADVFVAPTVEAIQIETAATEQDVAPVYVETIAGPEVSVAVETAPAEIAVAEAVVALVPPVDEVVTNAEPAVAETQAEPIPPAEPQLVEALANPAETPNLTQAQMGGNEAVAFVDQDSGPVISAGIEVATSSFGISEDSLRPSRVSRHGSGDPSADSSAIRTDAFPTAPLSENIDSPAPDPQSGHLGGNDPIAIPETSAPEALATPSQASSSVAPLASVPILGAMRELFVKALGARQNRKEKKLSRILNLFTEKITITNDDVEKFLHVSDSTATRYLSRLEKDGKIKQGDKKGSGVSYTRV